MLRPCAIDKTTSRPRTPQMPDVSSGKHTTRANQRNNPNRSFTQRESRLSSQPRNGTVAMKKSPLETKQRTWYSPPMTVLVLLYAIHRNFAETDLPSKPTLYALYSMCLPSARRRVREELQRAAAAEAEAKAVAEEAAHSTLQGERLEGEDPKWSKAAIMKEAMAELEGSLQAAEIEVSVAQYYYFCFRTCTFPSPRQHRHI